MDNHFDLVIIGSGLGGLLSAVIMAKEGYKVAVLEQNRQIGGCLQTFSFGKKVFDSCVHYIGGLDPGQTQHRIFTYAGIMDDLKLQKLDPDGFDRAIFGDKGPAFPLAQGPGNFINCLLPYFPTEIKALKEYVRLLEKVSASFPLYTLRGGLESEKEWVKDWELSDTLAKLTNNPLLQSVLSANSLLYAGHRGKTPFYIHALVVKSFMDSAYKCVGGSSQIARFLSRKLREFGGHIFTRQKVNRLMLKDGLVRQAITEGGMAFAGEKFIVNVHPGKLLEWIDDPLIRPVYRNRITRAENSVSAFMVNIVLKPSSVSYQNHNIYWNKTEDALAEAAPCSKDWPRNYALYFGADAHNKGWADTLAILTYMHPDEVKPWKNTVNRSAARSGRCPEYLDFKNRKAQVLIDCVARRFPELREHISSMKVATPLTFRDYMGTSDGSMYGIVKDIRYPASSQVPLFTKVPNLLLTGQNIGLHGVLGVSISAVATCSALLGQDYLLSKINRV